MESIKELRRGVHEWLVNQGLDRDTSFYTRAEWEARKEPYLAGSNLILVFEGELYDLIYSRDKECFQLYQEFEQLVQGFGYYFEFGHAWNMGFYPLPAGFLQRRLRVYSEQLPEV